MPKQVKIKAILHTDIIDDINIQSCDVVLGQMIFINKISVDEILRNAFEDIMIVKI